MGHETRVGMRENTIRVGLILIFYVVCTRFSRDRGKVSHGMLPFYRFSCTNITKIIDPFIFQERNNKRLSATLGLIKTAVSYCGRC